MKHIYTQNGVLIRRMTEKKQANGPASQSQPAIELPSETEKMRARKKIEEQLMPYKESTCKVQHLQRVTKMNEAVHAVNVEHDLLCRAKHLNKTSIHYIERKRYIAWQLARCSAV